VRPGLSKARLCRCIEEKDVNYNLRIQRLLLPYFANMDRLLAGLV